MLSVSLDKVRDAESGATDPSYGSQWALPAIGWEDVHGVVNPAGSSTLAVLDTGVDASAPDLAGRLVQGWSFDGSDPAIDANGHGTHVATISAGGADDGTGIAGVAYAGVSVMPVRVLGADGTGQDADIIEGLVYAVDHGANVVVMAFSNPGESAALQAAVDYAWSQGVVVVAAAGNDGGSTATYPAGLSKVVGVGATAPGDAVASFSNQSAAVFIGAPGSDIAASDAAGVSSMTGTSASAAVLAGSAALLRANDPSASAATIVGRLARNADATTGGSSGNGRVNLARAMADTSTAGVTPAGVPGGGGPVVGPYVTAASDGDGAMTVTPGAVLAGSTGNAFTFDFFDDGFSGFNSSSQMSFVVPATWTAPQTSNSANPGFVTVAEGTGSGTNSCDPGTATITGSGPWTVTIPQTCGTNDHLTIVYGAGTSATKVTAPSTVGSSTFTTSSRDGTTGSATITTSPVIAAVAVDTFADSGLTTPKTTFSANDTVYLRVRGLPVSQSDFSVAWVKSGVDCTNTAGTGRPDTTGTGQLPSNYLQYPPTNAAPDNWNQLNLYETQTCPALSSSNAGTWSLQLTHSSVGTITLPAFSVAVSPTISTVGPAALGVGAPSQTVTVTGANFASGAVVSISGTGLTVAIDDVRQLDHTDGSGCGGRRARPPAPRTLTVTNPDTQSGTSTFTVNPAPTVTSLSPNSLGQGATSQNVTINGTNFVSGTWPNSSVAFSGTGITVNSVTRASATALTVNVTIAGSAATGPSRRHRDQSRLLARGQPHERIHGERGRRR